MVADVAMTCDAERASNAAAVRTALIKARAVLVTCVHDTPEDLANPTRKEVLGRRIEECNRALSTTDVPAVGA